MEDKHIAFISAGVSIAAALVSGVFSFRALQRQAFANRVQATAARNQYFGELRKWADDTCEILSAALHLCDLDPAKCHSPTFFERRHNQLIRLSALIDRGRWFFPNKKREGVGADKLPSFQGYRHKVLDALVRIYGIVGKLDFRQQSPNLVRREEIQDSIKAFVHEIQEVLSPRVRAEEFERIISEST